MRAMILTLMALCAPTVLAQPGPPPPAPPLPPVPFPTENPFSEEKRVLGKILFWDVQLSSDNTIACGTCHKPQLAAGADPRVAIHPGLDGVPGTLDDAIGSPGVIRADADGNYQPDAVFDLFVQATGRAANPSVMAMFANELFWDGRATDAFVDPVTGVERIATGGALESQAVGPPLSDVEMAHADRDWAQIRAKISAARPLALASDLPADVAGVLASRPSYLDLFDEAFGSPEVTAARIAFAIATYERTLIPDQTPYDAFANGDQTALTPQQLRGFQAMGAANCLGCHTPPFFTDHTFRNVGLRPIAEDNGREAITGNPADAGRFKVPTLRSVGLKPTFMHNGQLLTLGQVINFYVNRQGQFPQNQDPLMAQINLPPNTRPDIIEFMTNGLTDPRVANGVFPFDRPTLHDELPANPRLRANGTAGSGGLVPQIIANAPPALGDPDFKIGVRGALGGAEAFVVVSRNRPQNGVLPQQQVFGPFTLEGEGAGNGYGTFFWPIPTDEMEVGGNYLMQWRITDPEAVDGVALSRVADFAIRCAPCDCIADASGDRVVDLTDLGLMLANFGELGVDASRGDTDGDGDVDLDDLTRLLIRFGFDCGPGH